ncbi:MAG: hypothetical protein M3P26_12900 [Gemmatimonadota bacterium]|nr:hypothetical protein [Gemmatimonadota bacterium]
MNLLAAALYDPATAVSKVTTAALAMTAIDTTNLRLPFTVPQSGKVRVRMMACLHGAATYPSILLGVMSGATVKGRVAPVQSLGNTAVATALVNVEADFIVTGETPGAAVTWDAAYAVETLVAATGLKYGGPNNATANDAFGAFVFEIWDPQPITVDAAGRVDVGKVLGTAQTAGDLKASLNTLQADTDDMQTRLPTALVSGRMDSSVGAMAANVLTAAAINASALAGKGDWNIGKTGYALSAAGVQAIWDALTSALATAGSIGKLIVDNLNATVSSRMATFTLPSNFSALSITAGGLVDITQAAADKAWSTTTRTLTALTASLVQEIWDRATSLLTVAGSIGKRLADDIDATISSRSTFAGGAVASVTGSVGSVATGGMTAASFAVGAIDALALDTSASNEIRDAVTGAVVDGTTTLAESLRLANAALGGKSSGHAVGSPVYRDLADSKNRITATTDVDGNRSAVTTDLA